MAATLRVAPDRLTSNSNVSHLDMMPVRHRLVLVAHFALGSLAAHHHNNHNHNDDDHDCASYGRTRNKGHVHSNVVVAVTVRVVVNDFEW